ncbi:MULTISPECIES: DUF1146 family protein [Paenibacillus]|uniref:DUF1146 family protein n=1 Tax=Paenibacillus TaxID=44249 RepID=UPI0003690177|nr:DUF1146 family protein [Paenibacillus terrigena]
MDDSMTSLVGLSGLVGIIVTLGCIGLAWWALQAVKFDLFLRNAKGPQGKLLHVFLSVIIGHWVSEFVLQYWEWTQRLKGLF